MMYFHKTSNKHNILSQNRYAGNLNISDAVELEICELSRAEPSWIFPSRAELANFKMQAEPSWQTLKCELAELDIFRNELNLS